MGKFDAVLKWCKERRDSMIEDLEPMEAGRFQLRENDGSGWRDITQRCIAETKKRIEEMERIIVGYEKHND